MRPRRRHAATPFVMFYIVCPCFCCFIPQVQALCDQVREAATEKNGSAFAEYKAVSYASQVVSGVNYFVKAPLPPIFPLVHHAHTPRTGPERDAVRAPAHLQASGGHRCAAADGVQDLRRR